MPLQRKRAKMPKPYRLVHMPTADGTMTLKDKLKELFFELTHNPNSPEGLRHRADILIEKGFKKSNPMVTALQKMADMEEEKRS